MQGAGPEGGHLGLKWDATVTGIGLTSFATTLAPSLCSSNKMKINIEEETTVKAATCDANISRGYCFWS